MFPFFSSGLEVSTVMVNYVGFPDGTQLEHMIGKQKQEGHLGQSETMKSFPMKLTTASTLPLGCWSRSRSSSLLSAMLTFTRWIYSVKHYYVHPYILNTIFLSNKTFCSLIVASWCRCCWSNRRAGDSFPSWKTGKCNDSDKKLYLLSFILCDIGMSNGISMK